MRISCLFFSSSVLSVPSVVSFFARSGTGAALREYARSGLRRGAPGISAAQKSNGDCDELGETRWEDRLVRMGVGVENVHIGQLPNQLRRIGDHQIGRRRTRGLARAAHAAAAREIRTR